MPAINQTTGTDMPNDHQKYRVTTPESRVLPVTPPGMTPPAMPLEDSILPPPPLNRYQREIKPCVYVDVYDILGTYTGHYPPRIKPMVDHLVKKLLAGGERGHKTLRQDMEDVRDSAQRALDILDEWDHV